MPSSAIAARILIFTLLAVGYRSAGEADKRQHATELLTQAKSQQAIRAEGSKPFHLYLRIHAERIVAKPIDGTYEEVWLSPDNRRHEIVFPGFRQVVAGDENAVWVTRNLDFRPRVEYLITEAIERFVHPELSSKEKIVSLHEKKKKSIAVQCAELGGAGAPNRELCFDSSGALFSDETMDQRFEYADYRKFEGKIFPSRIQVYESGAEVLNLAADDLSQPHDVSPKLFEHEPGALKMAPCERPSTDLVKKVPPHYPEDARQARQQGTVILYALVSGDGQIEKIKVLEGPGRSLEQAAVDAVQQWVYAPARCGTVALPTEMELRVNFTLSFQ
ncbi:MAG TPA: TonB family protein [Candidatus Sulfotelmatobacter sp.]|nr:TonB family protein [Candidatus Sulfotelmatobacter sp.]